MLTSLRTLVGGAPLAVAFASTVAASALAQNARLTRGDLVVTSDWLATQLKNPKLVLFHVGEKAEYDAAHIPGARHQHARARNASCRPAPATPRAAWDLG